MSLLSLICPSAGARNRRGPGLLLVGLAALGVAAPVACAQRTDIRGVTRTEFNHWKDALSLESRDAAPRGVVVPALGGRVMSYGLRGENVLWVNPETAGRTYSAGEPPFEPGGFYCDIGPEVAAFPPHPMLSLGPNEWSAKHKTVIALRAREDKNVGVELEKELLFDPSTGELGFVHRIKNITDREAAYCLWHRVACRPGGFVIVPVNKKSRFPKGWSLRQGDGGRLHYEANPSDNPAVQVSDGVLVAQTGGAAAKIGADSDAQWLAYALGRTLFVIHFPYYSGAVYSEGGNSLTISWNETMTELQPMSPEARLRSRKSYDFPIKWSLIELPAEVTDSRQARALASKIPSSPFL